MSGFLNAYRFTPAAMQKIHTIEAMQEWTRAAQRGGRRVALVPTMGYLHEGHLSLIRLAREKADQTVVSLFVNPTQFGPNEDYDRYPRDHRRDEQLCAAEQVDVIFHPSAEEMYAKGHSVYVDESNVSGALEGTFRPGHFRGVLTVVAKLFLAVLPDVAVFGRKDAQQLWLLRKMTSDLNFPTSIVAGPTVREPDGLAMSSRNEYLKGTHREQAVCLHRALQATKQRLQEGERNAYQLRKVMLDIIGAASDACVDYIEIVDTETFSPVTVVTRPALAVLAVRIGGTRLIDNVELAAEGHA